MHNISKFELLTLRFEGIMSQTNKKPLKIGEKVDFGQSFCPPTLCWGLSKVDTNKLQTSRTPVQHDRSPELSDLQKICSKHFF